jgi:hypothetical protein
LCDREGRLRGSTVQMSSTRLSDSLPRCCRYHATKQGSKSAGVMAMAARGKYAKLRERERQEMNMSDFTKCDNLEG